MSRTIDIQTCLECGNNFDAQNVTSFDCPNCEKSRRESEAEKAINKQGSLCYARTEGKWSPAFVDGVCVQHRGNGEIVVKCEDGQHRISNIGSFNVYLQTLKQQRQMELF